MSREKLIIVGPCAVESQSQVQHTTENAKRLGIDSIRLNLWKPRTRPGWDGVHEIGLPWVREAAQDGLNIAMEVLTPEHAEILMEEILAKAPNILLIPWIGSRNQNDKIQKQIGSVVAREERVKLMVKNQPWESADHWIGIIEHLESVGVQTEQLMLCHRGFSRPNAEGLRNAPNLDLALKVQHETGGLPLLLDPSHIGGTVELVRTIATNTESLFHDGQLIEVHPDRSQARTDARQQLTWGELEEILPLIKRTHLQHLR